MTLSALAPGQRFSLADWPYQPICGTLISASESRAVVRLDRPPQVVELDTADGRHVTFIRQSGCLTTWAPATPVERE